LLLPDLPDFLPERLASTLKEEVAVGATDCAAAGVEITTMGVAIKAALINAEISLFMVNILSKVN
jgi:hypothetical protein